MVEFNPSILNLSSDSDSSIQYIMDLTDRFVHFINFYVVVWFVCYALSLCVGSDIFWAPLFFKARRSPNFAIFQMQFDIFWRSMKIYW